MTLPEEIRDSQVAEVMGAAASDCAIEALPHNPRNRVTRGVWRLRSPERSAVLKVLSYRPGGDAPEWEPSSHPRHWNYWKREALFYASPLRERLSSSGIQPPTPLACFESGPRQVCLWLEDVPGRRGDAWDLDDHRAAARALGRLQGRALKQPADFDAPWLSRGFLRDYPASKPVRPSLLEEDAVWKLPLVAETLGESVRRAGRLLHAEQPRMLAVLARLPRTLCHLDFWPMNLIRRPGGGIAALDWSFLGDGALGEDLGNHVPDTAFDLFVPASELAELDAATFQAYLAGLRELAWEGDERIARLGVCGSAIKYAWLLPLLLERAQSGQHHAYGGGAVGDLAEQYRQRGQTLEFLAGWLQEARRLAGVLGLSGS